MGRREGGDKTKEQKVDNEFGLCWQETNKEEEEGRATS